MLLKRFKEPSTWAGIGVASLTYLQQTGDWKGAIFAAIASIVAILTPEKGLK
jgi:uncharacterized membrane protein YjjP (DUF1212 family)